MTGIWRGDGAGHQFQENDALHLGGSMRFSFFSLALTMSALLLAGCGTPLPVHKSLPLAARDQIASTETVVPIRQHEIYVFVPPSTAGATAGAGFGIVGALVGVAIDASVDSARTSKAEAAVKPLRDALVDYNFDATFQDDLKASLPPVGFMHSDEIRVVKEVANDSADLALTNSKDAAVLFVTTDYHLANDGDVLYVTLQTSLYPNSAALKAIKPPKKPSDPKTALANALYHNTLTFKDRVAGWSEASDRDHSIGTWDASNGAAMRASLTLAAKELAQALAADLQHQDSDAAGQAATIDGVAGAVVTSDDTGSLVRMNDGTLVYATKSML